MFSSSLIAFHVAHHASLPLTLVLPSLLVLIGTYENESVTFIRWFAGMFWQLGRLKLKL